MSRMSAQPEQSANQSITPLQGPATGWRRFAQWFPFAQSVSLLVLAVSLLTTYQLWRDASQQTEQLMQADFDYLVAESDRRIEQRMLTYEQVLHGVAGLFAAQKNVTRDEFRAYFEALRLEENYPGIQGIGYAALIPPAMKEKYIAAVRSEGFPEFTITPPGERAVYSSILFLEPFAGINLRAFGFDMYTEPIRRAAMEQARDAADAAVSSKVVLVQETDRNRAQSGFLMYLPVYRPGAPHDTIESRRANLAGWVYAPFRMDDLMNGLINEQSGNVDMMIYDGKEITPGALMYTTNIANAARSPSRLSATRRLNILGHDWTMVISAFTDFGRQAAHDKAPLILRMGLAASILLTLLTWLLIDDRTRAWQVARMAFYDALTGLPNRKLFTDRLFHAITKARRDKTKVAVMFIDLDKFKPVNDKFGHAVGDLLLKEVAKRLHDCLRESDTVARLGGDEFIMLVSYTGERRSHMVVAEKILQALTSPFFIAGHTHHISASIGVAVYPQDGLDEKQLLKNADTAMYHAKKSGRNNIKLFHPELEEAAQ